MSDPTPYARSEKREPKEKGFDLLRHKDFLGFQDVTVTERDQTKTWKPATKVDVTKADGSVVKGIDANTPFFKFVDAKKREMTVTAAAAGHVDSIHIKGKDAGSKFAHVTLEELMFDVADHLPGDIVEQVEARQQGVGFAMEMGKNMGLEGLATREELLAEGKITPEDLSIADSVKNDVMGLNLKGDQNERKEFCDEFRVQHPDCRIQFQVIRGGEVIVPHVATDKRPTTSLFMVFGPGSEKGAITMYTAAPGRYMDKMPVAKEHTGNGGVVNTESFNASSEAWFNTVMLTGNSMS